eukprot:9654710-Ditylum_brightwellii.AAC.1
MCPGTSVSVLEQGTDIPHLEGKWLQSMLQDLQATGGKIHLVNTWVVPTRRVDNKHLMDIFCTSSHIQQQQYSHLNYCCIYLKVTCLSDITTSDGRYVKDNMLNCMYPQSPKCKRNLDWPQQSCPGKQVWKLWKKTLTETICNNNRKLHETLGEQTEDSNQWNWRYHKDNVYQCTKEGWT